jgi:hypothetical protein
MLSSDQVGNWLKGDPIARGLSRSGPGDDGYLTIGTGGCLRDALGLAGEACGSDSLGDCDGVGWRGLLGDGGSGEWSRNILGDLTEDDSCSWVGFDGRGG